MRVSWRLLLLLLPVCAYELSAAPARYLLCTAPGSS